MSNKDLDAWQPSAVESTGQPLILTINCGSSSVKFALYAVGVRKPMLSGTAESLGQGAATIRYDLGGERTKSELNADALSGALETLLALLRNHGWLQRVRAVGHRVVHGGERFSASTLITSEIIVEIEANNALAPLHNPSNLAGISAAMAAFPSVPQVAVFDTAFHQTIPAAAYLYALPHRYYRDYGVRRYGFHGTSHRYVAGEAVKLLGLNPLDHGLVIAHLGNGASATAVANGVSVDTSMGLTPLEGLVMGTRSGDVDFGALCYIARQTGLNLASLEAIANRESGLLGLSELSNDCRTLVEAAEGGHERAREALDVFVHRLAGCIGRLATSLPRLDAVVFTGGIGENSAPIRRQTINRLSTLRIYVDDTTNDHAVGGRRGLISRTLSPAALVIPTDEEWMIARDTAALAGLEIAMTDA